jgi:hypothetical protein
MELRTMKQVTERPMQLVRRGKIRLGIKVRNPKGVEYPKEVEYFVLPEDKLNAELKERYGDKPTRLPVMLPKEDLRDVFPHARKLYAGKVLRCKGNGEQAIRSAADLIMKNAAGKLLDDATERLIGDEPNGNVAIGCPDDCPMLLSKQCKVRGCLFVFLHEVTLGAVFQIDGGFSHIPRIRDGMEMVRSMFGRASLVPCWLYREPVEMRHEGTAQTHYIMRLELAANFSDIAKLKETVWKTFSTDRLVLPAYVEDGPEPTGDAPVEEEPQADAPATQAPPPPAAAPELPFTEKPKADKQGKKAPPPPAAASPTAEPQTDKNPDTVSGPPATTPPAQDVSEEPENKLPFEKSPSPAELEIRCAEWADSLWMSDTHGKLDVNWKVLTDSGLTKSFSKKQNELLKSVYDARLFIALIGDAKKMLDLKAVWTEHHEKYDNAPTLPTVDCKKAIWQAKEDQKALVAKLGK